MESQLKKYLKDNRNEVMYLSLWPKKDSKIIEKEAVNIAVVSISGVEKEFENISESVYDKLVTQYDWREVKKKIQKQFIKSI